MAISIDDRRLVESCQAGDVDAFADLVRVHGPSLLGHALRRLNDRSDAEDAVQETFIRAYRAMARFDGEYRVGPWLHRILANVCADEGNRRRRETAKFDRFAADPFAAEITRGVEDELGLDIDDMNLRDALETLPASYREALSLRFVDELPYAEVARVAGVSEQNARARVSRARTAARAALRGVAAFPVLFIPMLRRSERVVAAAQQSDTVRAGTSATAGGAASSVAPALPLFSPLADAAMAAAPAGVPMLTKAAIGLGMIAAVAVPTAGNEYMNHSRVTVPVVAPPAQEASVGVASPTAEAPPGPTATVPVTEAPPAPTVLTTDAPVSDELAPEVAPSEAVTLLPMVPSTTPGEGATDSERSEGERPADTMVIPAPLVRHGGGLAGESITVTPAGPRLDVAGSITLTVNGVTTPGTVTARLLPIEGVDGGIDRINGEFLITLATGERIELSLRLTAAPTGEGETDGAMHFMVTGPFRAASSDAVGLLEAGQVTGSIDLVQATFSLTFTA